jgi:hypothetical protein
VQAAERVVEQNGRPSLGPASVRILWKYGGTKGRGFLKRHIQKCTLPGIRTLLWMQCGLHRDQAADALNKAQLTELKPFELCKAASGSDQEPDYPDDPAQALWLLRGAKRCTGFDGESDSVPPDYAWLLENLCRATAGILDFESAEVTNGDDLDADEFEVVLQCNEKTHRHNVANTGDWFDSDIFTLVHKAVRSTKHEDQFQYVWEDGSQAMTVVFGPPVAISAYAEQFAIPLTPDGNPIGDGPDSFRQALIGKSLTQSWDFS